jgi:hypothetical protein
MSIHDLENKTVAEFFEILKEEERPQDAELFIEEITRELKKKGFTEEQFYTLKMKDYGDILIKFVQRLFNKYVDLLEKSVSGTE